MTADHQRSADRRLRAADLDCAKKYEQLCRRNIIGYRSTPELLNQLFLKFHKNSSPESGSFCFRFRQLVYLPKSRKFLTLQYSSPITHLPLLSPLMSVILVLLSIIISLSPTTSPTSPAPASCTFVTSAAYDPCLTLKLPPPLPPPLFILN